MFWTLPAKMTLSLNPSPSTYSCIFFSSSPVPTSRSLESGWKRKNSWKTSTKYLWFFCSIKRPIWPTTNSALRIANLLRITSRLCSSNLNLSKSIALGSRMTLPLCMARLPKRKTPASYPHVIHTLEVSWLIFFKKNHSRRLMGLSEIKALWECEINCLVPVNHANMRT